MKRTFTGSIIMAAMLLVTNCIEAQTVTTAKRDPAVTPSQVLAYANDAKANLGGRVYDPIQIRKRIDKSSPLYKLLPWFDKGNALLNKVIAEGSNITPVNAIKYEKEMKEYSDGITRLIAVTQVSNEIPGCFKGCDDNYPGLGGGAGWKRFTCKMACLIVETAN